MDDTGMDTLMTTSRSKSTPAPAFAGLAWQQVLARDTQADGQFVYAVKSTGIYCKPSCPSRKPERRNVSFFSTPALAEEAGFRACLRCQPQLATPRTDPQAALVEQACALLSKPGSPDLERIAAEVGLSKFTMSRAFQRILGVTPGDYARNARRTRLRERVREPRTTITEAIYDAGFGSSSRVYESLDAILGMTPSAWKDGGKGETIRWAVGQSFALGEVLAAATDRGLCAVFFADSEGEAAAELRERFPQAVLRHDNEGMGEMLRSVLAYLEESDGALNLPVDLRATAFQQRVWKALLAIPRGETRTYAEIAESIGAPKSARAVGTACGANPLGVIIPCHRVVGATGALTGYRWGKERKRTLLEQESR
ncbi:bifunctional DNA-binding transcriptional regulator/O6-methylguanine-DNA methyltransferase Ada [Granulicella cerasi]|uniref:Bifunctional DNA-binding transcriptional regulator/O6-methylguanine-DNA methyltransferase Ada n=1 Tax=Granulicella cerasi TaxID=741063 RepID=A0ABW1ZC33_9BACT|nr:bifunctional DNA-binding transcriptional regulator/O6-methylguanine-DNA methyltransferase Ada [Granulicella cerasi]